MVDVLPIFRLIETKGGVPKYELYQIFNMGSRDVTGGLETIGSLKAFEQLDRTLIVPIIKDQPWLEETRKASLDRGDREAPDNVYEELHAELAILFPQDSPEHIRLDARSAA